MTTAYPFPRRRLGSTSVEVTALGFGAAALGNLFRAISDDTAQACLQAALDSDGFVFHYQPVISLQGETHQYYFLQD